MVWWFVHVERMERDRIVKRVYVGEFAVSRSVGRPRKRFGGLDIGQARRIVQDRSK